MILLHICKLLRDAQVDRSMRFVSVKSFSPGSPEVDITFQKEKKVYFVLLEITRTHELIETVVLVL